METREHIRFYVETDQPAPVAGQTAPATLPQPQQWPAQPPSGPVAGITAGASHTPTNPTPQTQPAAYTRAGEIPEPPQIMRPSSHVAAMSMIATGGSKEDLENARVAYEAKLAMGASLAMYRTHSDIVDIQSELESLASVSRALQLQWIQALNEGAVTRARTLQDMQAQVSEQIRDVRIHRELVIGNKHVTEAITGRRIKPAVR